MSVLCFITLSVKIYIVKFNLVLNGASAFIPGKSFNSL